EAVIAAQPMVQDCLVLQKGGQLVALVNLNLDAFKEYLGGMRDDMSDEIDRLKAEAEKFLDEMRAQINAQLSAFARISRCIPQLEPFEKTPTMKIKRYLYESRLNAG
ncbi:MAG: long-chain fatty acid--CoA ligase, partial [Spirochaetaceae bacterium]